MARERGGWLGGLVIGVVIGVAVGFLLARGAPAPPSSSALPPGAAPPPAAPASGTSWYGVPHPEPRVATFQGCPPQGDGGDPALNRLKNRIDVPHDAVAVPADSILALPWPTGAERRDHADWSVAERREVARYEGTPVAVEGYLASVKLEGPESPNCHGADAELRDWHVWLTARPGQERDSAIVVETTPRVRVDHPRWTTTALRAASRAGDRVRITGWLMLDPEHPDQLGKTRGTLWEIHPITGIEVRRAGRWVALDDLARPGRNGA